MNEVFRLERDDITPALRNTYGALAGWGQRRLLYAMGAKFKQITVENFGMTGIDRPSQWPQLSPKYARRVGRGYPTLDLRGKLFRSLGMTVHADSVDVYSDGVDYNEAHQFGNPARNLPARPYFPVNAAGTAVTPYCEQQMTEAANRELQAIFDRKPSSVII